MLSSVFFRTCVLVTWHATTPPCVYSPRLELTLVKQNAAFFVCWWVLNEAVSIYFIRTGLMWIAGREQDQQGDFKNKFIY